MDRDIIAVLNLQMRGEGRFPQRALNEIIEREELRKTTYDYVAQNPTLRS